MQKETDSYEIPADKLTYNHQGLGEERELGEAEIVRTFWGGTKVRIVHKGEPVARKFPVLPVVAVIIVLGGGAAAWFALRNPAPQPSSEPRMVVMPQDPQPASSVEAATGNAATSSVTPAPKTATPVQATEKATEKTTEKPSEKRDAAGKKSDTKLPASAVTPPEKPARKSPTKAASAVKSGEMPAVDNGAAAGQSAPPRKAARAAAPPAPSQDPARDGAEAAPAPAANGSQP